MKTNALHVVAAVGLILGVRVRLSVLDRSEVARFRRDLRRVDGSDVAVEDTLALVDALVAKAKGLS